MRKCYFCVQNESIYNRENSKLKETKGNWKENQGSLKEDKGNLKKNKAALKDYET
jgi:hypothetical protein